MLLATQLFFSRVVEKGEKPGWRTQHDMWPCLHLNQAKFGKVKLKKNRTFFFVVSDIKVWKGPHDATQHQVPYSRIPSTSKALGKCFSKTSSPKGSYKTSHSNIGMISPVVPAPRCVYHTITAQF